MVTLKQTAVLLLLGLTVLTSATAAQERSLYDRLGGYDAIAAVVHDFVSRMEADREMRLFVGFSNDTKRKLRQHVVDFVCAGTGGPCTYTGRSMKLAHAGAGITEKVWNLSGEHLIAALTKFDVPERERRELLQLITPLKDQIIDDQP